MGRCPAPRYLTGQVDPHPSKRSGNIVSGNSAVVPAVSVALLQNSAYHIVQSAPSGNIMVPAFPQPSNTLLRLTEAYPSPTATGNNISPFDRAFLGKKANKNSLFGETQKNAQNSHHMSSLVVIPVHQLPQVINLTLSPGIHDLGVTKTLCSFSPVETHISSQNTSLSGPSLNNIPVYIQPPSSAPFTAPIIGMTVGEKAIPQSFVENSSTTSFTALDTFAAFVMTFPALSAPERNNRATKQSTACFKKAQPVIDPVQTKHSSENPLFNSNLVRDNTAANFPFASKAPIVSISQHTIPAKAAEQAPSIEHHCHEYGSADDYVPQRRRKFYAKDDDNRKDSIHPVRFNNIESHIRGKKKLQITGKLLSTLVIIKSIQPFQMHINSVVPLNSAEFVFHANSVGVLCSLVKLCRFQILCAARILLILLHSDEGTFFLIFLHSLAAPVLAAMPVGFAALFWQLSSVFWVEFVASAC
ncbi:hypothetical protein LguiB_016549 [Lonicera macranthoides]